MKRAIGIIGGMGPQAGINLCNRLIELSVRDFHAQSGADFPEIVLDSVPVPDFISDARNRKIALKMLARRVRELNRLDISCLGIACNTAHISLPALKKISKIPFVSMIEAVCASVPDSIERVGLLATPVTIRCGLYQELLAKSNKKVIVPNASELKIIESVIRNVIRGKMLKSDSEKLRKIARSLEKRGVQIIILGCTELPLVFPKKFTLPVFNSLEILAINLLKKAM